MTDENRQEPIEIVAWEWAIVEIFGHRRHVGKACEQERFGAKMLRIDVPKIGATKDDVTWSSHFYGGSSIFSYTVTDEKTVMNYAERSHTPALPYRDHGQSMEEAADDSFGLTQDDLEQDEDEGGDPTTSELLKPRGNGGVVDDEVCFNALLLVGSVDVSESEIAKWTSEQKAQAYDWAMRLHLNASDNDDVLVPPRPDFMPVGRRQ